MTIKEKPIIVNSNLSKPGAVSFFLSRSRTSKNVTYRIVPAAKPCKTALPIV